MDKRVTIADVAKEAGVSMMTVSRAMNNKEGISAETRKNIIDIADRLGYHPSGIARALATNQSCTIGLVMPDVANPFFAEVTKGVEDLAYRTGYNVLLVNTDEDLAREESVLNSLIEKQVDGAILISSRLQNDKLNKYIQLFPFSVVINRDFDEIPPNCATINVNDVLGAQKAVAHLVSRNHKKIAFVAGPEGSVSGQRRRSGFIRGLKQNGLIFEEELIVTCKPDVEGGYQSAKKLLGEKHDVTALLGFNDLVAFGIYRACDEMGLEIPHHIEVIGFDDIPIATLMKPSLSTLKVDKRALGQQAMKTLLKLISGDKEICINQDFQSVLINRESSPC